MKMTSKQLKARNEAFQLLSIAQRILGDAALTAYAEDVASIRAGMEMDARMTAKTELHRRLPFPA
jgi:multidrug resistance efflux pump